ncbi:MAG TPA: TonB-dependent receptor [Opitutaceae bacterium]|nr:TonB-dependent receptor [Opitutaceae bacterium]
MRFPSLLFRTIFLGAAVLLPLPAVRAEPADFDLPAQPADNALLAFARQGKVELLFSSAELHDVNSLAVTGRYEPADALARLLRGTGFVSRANGRGKFVVVPIRPPTGSIRGQLLAPDGTAAAGLRVAVANSSLATVTDDGGEFIFAAVPPGTHQLVVTGGGYQSLQINGARVDSGRVRTLEAQTMRRPEDVTRLEPFVVEGRSTRTLPVDGNLAGTVPPTPAGNLDLRRSEDDVLPYNIYDRDQIVRSGVVNLNEFIQQNVLDSDASTRPLEQRPGDDFGVNNQTGTKFFKVGSTNLNLRGYGADETVVLVNGRRLPEILSSNATTQQPDVNFIPLSLVQRVEVLPISASAVYSGNAVGGVINIVLRPEADATEVNATYTNALGHFDAPQSTVSLQHGRTLLDGALRIRLDATFTQTMPATEAELGYTAAHLASLPLSGQSLYRATPNVQSAAGSPLFGPGTAAFTSVAPGADGAGGAAAFTGREGVRSLGLLALPGGLANSPYSVDEPYGQRQSGESYFGSATYDVFPWLQVGIDGIHTHTVASRGYNVFPGDLVLGADSPFNPFHQDLNVSLNEGATALGENYSQARLDFSSVVLGLLLRPVGDWSASLDTQYGHSVTRYRGLAGIDAARWQQLVDQGLYNPLRDTQTHGAPAEFYDRALIYYGGRGRFVTFGNYDALDAALRLSNVALPFPTGTAAVNFGGDYRRNHLAPYTSEQRYGDGSLAAAPVRLSGRTLQRVSVFGELQAPLLPVRWLPDWIREIQADVAARYVAANSSQESNLAPTGGLKVDFAGGFSLRGTVATSNRLPPPNLSGNSANLNAGTAAGGGEISFVTVNDPRRGGESNNKVAASDALNSNLRPEAAVTWTAGAMFRHGQTHQFRLSVDFTDTRKSGELANLDAQEVVDLEAQLPGRVTRAAPAPGDPLGVGPITSVLTGTFNLAYRHSQNWSTAADYTWTECLGGRLEIYGRWLGFQRFDVQVLPTSAMVDELSQPDSSSLGLLRHRVNFGASWSRKDYGFGVDGHYFHSRILPLGEQPAQGSDRIAPYSQFDAYVQGDLARWIPWKSSRFGLRGQIRVNNLSNAGPPKYTDDSLGTGVQSYGDWRGRVYSLSLTATF